MIYQGGISRCLVWSRQIQNKRKAFNDLVLRDYDGRNGYEINKLRKELNDLLDCEEIMW